MHISRVDLNLFIVFEAIYNEGTVTRASIQLNLTQPAISHALKRLRTLFDDPLFVRQGQIMVSTPLARSIIEPVRQALRGLEMTLTDSGKFNPALENKQFHLALRDVLEATVLPPLLAQVTRTAPGINLAAIQVERRELVNELAAGTLDVAIDMLLPLPNQIRRQQISRDTTVVLARAGHPLISGTLSLEQYLDAEHILASSRRKGMGLEDFELSRLGLQRRIRLRCQHYFAACRVVSQTELLLTMPEAYARIANEQFGNQILPLPLSMPSWDVYLYWHQNVTLDPANLWLREQIMQAFA
ncbi:MULTISPECIES: LysR family transcriptional regulator [unclassified Undibacterium]|uniref:LysR family transcriptional regulator n=1 Tax=unclassified Undibacterium TaxID=2630295 RepID=UPI002AC9255C|nr:MULTISPECIES: LysR family transcriptional regulator [unclassified Undibacterium]MEB0139794.1 LysR family transcriptional regulator [Undibacterium sp. CCC2.1]MEB0170498.1 LysR family transcriptional regulator [Undibacterium sp. CCC1.1]MEB0174439.1 LysR family transcriptional regulator [Undibacterium sp. CCC3.4]MEB0213764.1 LysR family transcriptional regulator [Undibacterium sp. 5I2]WPX43927.1 LysR family transcriptional regulator [Undibacterium sp. CCC3.4]